jgi:hypothetical protein
MNIYIFIYLFCSVWHLYANNDRMLLISLLTSTASDRLVFTVSMILTIKNVTYVETFRRGISHVVSPSLLTAPARFRARIASCGICGKQTAFGTDFRILLGCHNRPNCGQDQLDLASPHLTKI